ncbi:MAG: IS200/IS605 family element transposase accessory protein TnpB [Candidatus Portnoybacteria bacterium]|nr:IS200/IS605 family element transposase accessory protein TnpB [Candidatus Portnoybacteria bacterium]
MILTYVIKHNRDFSEELVKAKQVAEFAIKNRTISSKNVKHIGLKSVISNQILRKYAKNKKCKKISKVNLVIPSQGIKVDKEDRKIRISCLRLEFEYRFPNTFSKVNQIEISKDSIHISATIQEEKAYTPQSYIGIDRNATGHCVVAANESTGKTLKLGRQAKNTHNKYKNMRKKLQKKNKRNRLKKIKRREKRKTKDLNHKMSRKIVQFAKDNKAGIVLEDLKGIRKTKKQRKSFKYVLHSWSFYQLEKMIKYKAKLLGIPIFKIDPQYTSQQCSRCGLLGKREGKKFYCSCRTIVEDADVNAAFVIALRHKGILQSPVDRDVGEGSTDTPKGATTRKAS